MKSRHLILAIATLAAAGWNPARGEVTPLGHAPQQGQVQPAGFHGGDCGCHGGATVWGTSCVDHCRPRAALYPPCPNPCRGTLVAELVGDIKCAVDTGISNLFGCLLGCRPRFYDGCYGTDVGYGVGEYYGEGEIITDGEYIELGPTPAPPTRPGRDPFQDDPQPQRPTDSSAGQDNANARRYRSVSPARVRRTNYNQPTTATARRPANGQRPNPLPSHARQAKPTTGKTRTAQPHPALHHEHYRTRSTLNLRSAADQPELRFRSAD